MTSHLVLFVAAIEVEAIAIAIANGLYFLLFALLTEERVIYIYVLALTFDQNLVYIIIIIIEGPSKSCGFSDGLFLYSIYPRNYDTISNAQVIEPFLA